MKRILITGAAGFIGAHLVEHILDATDWEIVCLDRLDYSGNLNRLSEVTVEKGVGRVKVVHHDLKAEINSQIAKAIGQVNYIAHLAAGSHVDRSIEFPLSFVLDNVVGTTNLLDFARDLKGLDLFVYFSTDEVFGPAPDSVKFKEYDRYNSTNPYSASKSGAEELVTAYHNTYGVPAVITHTMNVFGERQHPEKFIPMCIQKVRDGEKITIHSDSTLTKAGSRHYIHAKDVCSGLMHIIKNIDNINNKHTPPKPIKIKKFNICGAEEIDNYQLANRIAGLQGKPLISEMVDFHSSRPGHDLRYALDGSLMKELGWEPQPVAQRLAETVNWTLGNPRWLG